MKGIILAGGAGTRLHPLTLAMSKQLMPVYDKPMIYYPLSILMLAGIKEVLIVSTPEHVDLYKALLGDGEKLGMRFEYVVQDSPDGLPQAFLLGEEFVGADSVALILGDNMLYGSGMRGLLQDAQAQVTNNGGGVIFGYRVPDPERFGIVSFDENGQATKIEEKPANPDSHYAIPGVYFFDNSVIEKSKQLQPSDRGELEIVDLHNAYLNEGQLQVQVLQRGVAWLDAGTHESLLQASNFVHIVEQRQGFKIGCIEEVAYRMGFIEKDQLLELAEPLKKSGYGNYLVEVSKEESN